MFCVFFYFSSSASAVEDSKNPGYKLYREGETVSYTAEKSDGTLYTISFEVPRVPNMDLEVRHSQDNKSIVFSALGEGFSMRSDSTFVLGMDLPSAIKDWQGASNSSFLSSSINGNSAWAIAPSPLYPDDSESADFLALSPNVFIEHTLEQDGQTFKYKAYYGLDFSAGPLGYEAAKSFVKTIKIYEPVGLKLKKVKVTKIEL